MNSSPASIITRLMQAQKIHLPSQCPSYAICQVRKSLPIPQANCYQKDNSFKPLLSYFHLAIQLKQQVSVYILNKLHFTMSNKMLATQILILNYCIIVLYINYLSVMQRLLNILFIEREKEKACLCAGGGGAHGQRNRTGREKLQQKIRC